MHLPIPTSSAPRGSPSLDSQPLITHFLTTPWLQLIFHFKCLLSSPSKGPDQATEKECGLPIFFPKYLEVRVGGGREAWYVGKGSVFPMEEGEDGVGSKGKNNA